MTQPSDQLPPLIGFAGVSRVHRADSPNLNLIAYCAVRNYGFGMATVKDLEAVFSAEPRLTPGTVRMVTRLLQDGGLLPKGRPGGWRQMPELTPHHCATWLVGLAVTRRSGLRNVKEAVARVNRVLGLVTYVERAPCFGDLLAKLIADCVNGEQPDGWLPYRFLFVNDDDEPSVEYVNSNHSPEGKYEGQETWTFVTPEFRALTEEELLTDQPTEFADAFVIGAEVLFNFCEVFDRATEIAEAEVDAV